MKLFKILHQILKPEYLEVLRNWESTAASREIKGLKLIGKIYTNKGQRKFHNKEIHANPNKVSLRDVEKNFRTQLLTSSYSSTFKTNIRDTRSQASIFKCQRLKDIPCSQVLNPLAMRFLQHWLDLDDEEIHQESVLVTLRSLFAVSNQLRGPIPQHNRAYKWVNPEENYKAHRLDTITAAQFLKTASHRKFVVRPTTRQQDHQDKVYKPYGPLNRNKMDSSLKFDISDLPKPCGKSISIGENHLYLSRWGDDEFSCGSYSQSFKAATKNYTCSRMAGRVPPDNYMDEVWFCAACCDVIPKQ